MVFSTFVHLCNHHLCLVPRYFITHNKILCPLSNHSLFLCPPSPWGPSVRFLFLQIRLFQTFHIKGIIQHVTFRVSLLSLSVFSGFICIVAHIATSFLFMTEHYPMVCLYHISFIHLSTAAHLDCFHLLGIANSAAVTKYLLVYLFSVLLAIDLGVPCAQC